MVTPEGHALGVIDAWTWARKAKDEADIKESERWKEGYGIVADRAQDRFVTIADREADIRALMEEARRRDYAADYLIRAKHNRPLEGGEKLWDSIAQQQPLGQVEFILEANGQRKARKVCQTLYAQRVTLPSKTAKEIAVTLIVAREENPPAGETALVWRLLTTRTVETLAQASELIDGYRRRWLIEILFRILKSGCRVESLQLGRIERLDRALMIYLIIAWRILHIVTTGQACPNLPCDVLFDQAAWTVQHRQQTPKLGDRVRLIAGFGGFLDRKSEGFPGAKSIWEGLEKVRIYAFGIEVARAVYVNSA